MGATTPIWVLLVVAGLGVLGTVAAGLGAAALTQRRADARETKTYDRELERERERWKREDRQRSAEDQRKAYLDFYIALQRAAELVYRDPEENPLPMLEAVLHLTTQLTAIDLLGTTQTFTTAREAVDVLIAWRRVDPAETTQMEEMHTKFLNYQYKAVQAMREDLSVPPLEGLFEKDGQDPRP